MASGRQSAVLRHATTALAFVMLRAPTIGLACEACKDAVKEDPVGTALSATTLVLIAMPLLLIGSIGGWVAYVYWRAARRALAGAASSTVPSDAVSQPV